MNEGKKQMVNKEHPKYQEYIEKCNALASEMEKELEKIHYTGGLDGPTNDIYKAYSQKLKALQREYAYLFTEEAE